MTEVYTLHSESGDEYKLQFTTDRSGIIADNLLDQLNTQGIEVVEIGLCQSILRHRLKRLLVTEIAELDLCLRQQGENCSQ